MSSIWIQWVMFQCATSSCGCSMSLHDVFWTAVGKVWQVWSKSNRQTVGKSLAGLKRIQAQTAMVFPETIHLIRCCWTIPCALYGSNEWCFNVQPAPVHLSMSLHAVFGTVVGISLADLKQIQAQTDDVFSHNTRYQMLLNHSVCIIWIQWVMFQCATIAPGGPSVSLHAVFLTAVWGKVWQVWSKSKPKLMPVPATIHLIRCCWTIPCPPYGSNEWCFNVQPAPVGCSMSLCAVFWSAVGKVWQVWSESKPKLQWCFQPQYSLSHAAEPFHVLHMDLMSDVSMCNQLLFTCLCHCMLCLGL
jgi:hypothetical protein